MMISHAFKTIEYFMVEGVDIPLDHITEVIDGLVFNTLKLITIYFSMLG